MGASTATVFAIDIWNGMEWNGIEWNGMEWNRMESNGIECIIIG